MSLVAEDVSAITNMGFSANAAERGLRNTGCRGARAAIEWIMGHMDDPDLNEPWAPAPAAPARAPAPAPAAAAASPEPAAATQRAVVPAAADARAAGIWRDKAFVGEFCDAFCEDTELEGGPQGPAIMWLMKMVDHATAEGGQLQGAPSLAPHAGALRWMQVQMRGAVEIDSRASGRRGERLMQFAREFVESLRNLPPGECKTFQGGWARPVQPKCPFFVLASQCASFRF